MNGTQTLVMGLAALVSAASASEPVATAGSPDAKSRTFCYATPDPTIPSPTITEVADAISYEFPLLSGYGPARDGKGAYSEISISSAGTRETGLLYVNVAGVKTSASPKAVAAEYIRGKRKTSGLSPFTTTLVSLPLSKNEQGSNCYDLSIGDVTEKIARDMLIFTQPPLDSVENIRGDAETVLWKLKPSVRRQINVRVEAESSYLPPAVFANFERGFGKPTRTDHTQDTRAGSFLTTPRPGVKLAIHVQVSPYRTGSKVVVGYAVPFLLNPDRSNSLDQALNEETEAAVRRLASE